MSVAATGCSEDIGLGRSSPVESGTEAALVTFRPEWTTPNTAVTESEIDVTQGALSRVDGRQE